MANVWLDNPPNLVGDEKQQLQQLYTYLYEVQNQLNTALGNLTIDQFAAEEQAGLREAKSGDTEQSRQTTQGLKELIVKTANVVRNEMESISTTLHSEYQAVSDQFGTLTEEIDNQIEATARGIVQQYDFQSQIDDLSGGVASFRSFSQRIFSGILDDTTGKVGIAIGENVTAADGTLNTGNLMATFTMDKLSFYQGGAEVAYFSNNTMFITKAEVAQELTIGNFMFKTLTDGSLALIKKGAST